MTIIKDIFILFYFIILVFAPIEMNKRQVFKLFSNELKILISKKTRKKTSGFKQNRTIQSF